MLLPHRTCAAVFFLGATLNLSAATEEETVAEKIKRAATLKDSKQAAEVLRGLEAKELESNADTIAAVEEVLPRLIELLRDPEAADEAAGLLDRFPALSLPALPVLLEHPGSAKSGRWFLLRSLRRVSEVRLMPYSHHDDRAIRIFVVRAFARPPGFSGSAQAPLKAVVLKRLRELLHDKDALVREVLEATESAMLEIRRAAAHSLRRMGAENAPKAGDRLLKLVGDEDPKVRWQAVSALGDRPGGREERRAIAGVLGDDDEEVARVAAESLGKLLKGTTLGEEAATYRDALIELLDHKRSINGATAARRFGWLCFGGGSAYRCG